MKTFKYSMKIETAPGAPQKAFTASDYMELRWRMAESMANRLEVMRLDSLTGTLTLSRTEYHVIDEQQKEGSEGGTWPALTSG